MESSDRSHNSKGKGSSTSQGPTGLTTLFEGYGKGKGQGLPTSSAPPTTKVGATGGQVQPVHVVGEGKGKASMPTLDDEVKGKIKGSKPKKDQRDSKTNKKRNAPPFSPTRDHK